MQTNKNGSEMVPAPLKSNDECHSRTEF